MILDDLSGLLQASRFLPRGEAVEHEAVRTVPELTDGLPPVVLDARGPRIWSGCGDTVRALCASLAADLLAASAAEPGAGTEGELEVDPVVVGLARLVEEGALLSDGAAVVPILEFLHHIHEAQAGSPLGAAIEDPKAARRIGAAVQARIAVALSRASTRVRIPALAWALSRARLLPLFPRGTLDRAASWAHVAEILEIPLPAGTVAAIEAAARLSVRGIAGRRSSGKLLGVDAILAQSLPPSRMEAGPDAAASALLLDPEAVRLLLPVLPQLLDVASLVREGVPGDNAARLCTAEGALAAVSVHVELTLALRNWDVLAQLVAAVAPAPTRGLAVPRSAGLRAAVVAVGLGRLRAEGAGGEAAWREIAIAADVGIFADLGWVGLGVFPDAVEALRFALLVHARIPTIPLSVSFGGVQGGTDGRQVRVWGSAVEAAVRWLPGPGRAPEQGIGRVRYVGGWLCGPGITVDSLASDAIQEARTRRGLTTGADRPPGGDPRVPRGIDLYRIFELDGEVLVFTRIAGVAGGFELLRLSPAEWAKILDKDGETAGSITAPRPGAAESSPELTTLLAAEVEEAGAWEMAEADEASEETPVTLDMEEEGDERLAAVALQPRFDFDEEREAVPPSEQGVFSGYYLPSADPTAQPGTPPSAPAAGGMPAFAMEVEDEDDTEEWGAAPFTPTQPAAGDAIGGDPFAAAPADEANSQDPFAYLPDPFGEPVPPASVAPPAEGDRPDQVSAFVLTAPAAGGPAEDVADSPSMSTGRRGAIAKMDFDFLLPGYACFVRRAEAVFGRPYGTRMVDHHVYPYSGDLDSAYLAFLKDKIAEGFIPRPDLIGDLPRGVTVMPLDAEKLTRAWREIA